MTQKKYLAMGMVAGFTISIAGLSFALKDDTTVEIITSKEAEAIMLEQVKGGKLVSIEYDNQLNTYKYDGSLILGNYEYEIDVDAKTGEVIKNKKELIDKDDSVVSTIEPETATSETTTSQNTKVTYITEAKAKEIMKTKVGNATLVSFVFDKAENEYEADYRSGNIDYDITVDAITGKVKEFTKDTENDNTAPTTKPETTKPSTTYISEAKAKEIMKTKVGNATLVSFILDKVENEYEADYRSGNIDYDITVDAITGKIKEFSKDVEEEYVAPTPKPETTKPSTTYISEARAKEIMKAKVGNATLVNFVFDKEDKEYEGDYRSGNIEYDITVDAVTGVVKEFSKDVENEYVAPTTPQQPSTSTGYISESKARSIMLGKVSGATIVSFEFDREDNEYSGEMVKGNIEYDISVNAKTGAIIEFESDSVEYDD